MYVSPGFLSQQLTGNEKSRNRNVEENLQVLESFGIKSLSKALFGSNHSGNTKGTHKRKNKAGHGNIDEDYLPSNGEGRVSSSEEDDDSSDDDVSSGSQANKVTSTGQGKKNGPGKKKGTSDAQPLRKSQRTQENGCQALQIQPHTVLAEGMTEVAAQPTQLPTSPTEQTNPFGSPHTIASSTGASSSKRVRGPTRGKNVDHIRKTLGQPIPVVINPETMSIEGKYATSVACAIGLNIRDHAPVRDIGWGDIDFGIRESIIMRVGQMFGLGDYKNDMVVRRVIDIKCQSLYANWKCDLYKHYKDLKKKKVSDIKSRALYPCNPNDWIFMIENVWETKDWKTKSKRGRHARSCLKFNHTSGSLSFAARAAKFIKENHKKQPFAEHFKETHIRHRLGKDVWINDTAKEAHQEIVRITSDVTNPQTEEHASVEVLGKRSGYLKGYGIRKNTKANAMPSQPIPNPEVVALQEKLANHEKVVANHEKAMADQAKMFQHMLMMVVMKSGIDPACIPGLVSCSGNEEDDTLAGEEDDEDMAAEIYLTQLPTLLEDPNVDFQPSPFFTKQFTAFEVWLDHGSEHKKPPEQLPIVLQALSVGIFPYVLKLLQTTTPELRQILVFIWTKILALDKVHI
ncbi:hypothetical protein RHGRI_014206 [Rhododendron griersonianum]|uniref:Uncharacterized protein n=1 Tax=Rhododendron griersonianum TaxID=479676 RepID=A0AAV6K8H1_9ERIC|nr:hypothetical protein RHGRI_014206 [Rhododendron griersonianum]